VTDFVNDITSSLTLIWTRHQSGTIISTWSAAHGRTI